MTRAPVLHVAVLHVLHVDGGYCVALAVRAVDQVHAATAHNIRGRQIGQACCGKLLLLLLLRRAAVHHGPWE